jgi:hypothetical protein
MRLANGPYQLHCAGRSRIKVAEAVDRVFHTEAISLQTHLLEGRIELINQRD